MSHLAQNTSAIFSPSVARAAASAAKDWSYIDSWLASKFPNRPSPPPFERNPETLKALLALASANESADEERTLISKLESEALTQLTSSPPSSSSPLINARHSILTALSASLTREGSIALTTLAQLSLTLHSSTIPEEIVSLTTTLSNLESTLLRLDILTSHLSSLTFQSQLLSNQLEPPRPSSSHSDAAAAPQEQQGYHPPSDLAISNLSAQRRIKSLTAKIPELRDKLTALTKSSAGARNEISIEQVKKEEEIYLQLLEEKKELDAQLASFAGLPHDVESARTELEGLREELRRVTARRDEVFEGLVERETPRKAVPRR
ncbi:hypothetical protein QBC43DRAFT_326768 [Cladorrhinum sp. PSN259]|nr:hypothetical protein QBC43DRAFT_326768 [Cladorrhinum sp. PSN259]